MRKATIIILSLNFNRANKHNNSVVRYKESLKGQSEGINYSRRTEMTYGRKEK